ncbi:hypothetical protein A2U01_0056636, partial [Trifolium medium]|nr:hypothetical protein [Trifolium medium]
MEASSRSRVMEASSSSGSRVMEESSGL